MKEEVGGSRREGGDQPFVVLTLMFKVIYRVYFKSFPYGRSCYLHVQTDREIERQRDRERQR